jgi:hypothetical protein
MKVQDRNKRNVISEEKAKEIKNLLKERYTHKQIANMTRISHHVVSCISKGHTWKEI